MDPASRLGIQVGFDKIDRVDLSDGFVMRFEPYGQYVLPGGTLGLYGQLPIAHLFDSNGADGTGIGNLDLGAFFMPLHNADLILRVGIALPTGSSSGDDMAANIISAYERMTDLMLVGPEYTVLRLSASTLQESGIAFFRGDFGLDLAIDKPSGSEGIFLRANLAGGVRLPAVDLSAELVNLGVLDGDVPGGLDNRFMHTLAFGLQTRGVDKFRAGMVFPLDDSLRGEVWILSLGYQHVIN